MKETFRRVAKFFPLLFFALFLGLILLPYYQGGKMISGGEGSYFSDFILLLKNYGYSWMNYGVGVFSTSLNFGFIPHLFIFQILFNDERIVNFIMIFLIYFLPFLAIYLLSLKLKLRPWPALLISLFYVVNPFMANFLKSINQWNMLAAYIFPAFFWLILRFYDEKLKLFLFFGLHSLFFSFTNANPPTMLLYQIAVPIFILLIVLYKENKFGLIKFIRTYFLVFSSFFLFNLWWIANWFYIFLDAQQGYPKEFAISWLRGLGPFIPAVWQALNLANLLIYPPSAQYNFFNFHYSHPWALLILTIPILLGVCFFSKKKMQKGYFLVLGLLIVIALFLSKGVQDPLGVIYELMVMKLPLFSLFKTAKEKWGLLFVFFLTLFLIFIFERLEKKQKRLFSFLLIIYVGYCSFPFLVSNFIPDYQFNSQIIGSRRFLDKKEYQTLKKKLNHDPEQYRVLSLPGSANYQVALQIEDQRFYTGNDPVLSNTNKPFIAPYTGSFIQRFHLLHDFISSPTYLNLLGLYNIKKIVVNKDSYPWFGFREGESIREIETILDEKLEFSKDGAIDVYDAGDYFLPRFFVSERLVYSAPNNQQHLPLLLESANLPPRTTFFIDSDESNAAEVGANQFIKENSSEILLIDEARSAVNERELRTGVMGMNRAWVLFPYARWQPGSLFYSYVLKKEAETKKQFTENSESLFGQHLFFAAKRIYEIQKWGGKLDDELFDQILKAYEKEMLAAIKIIENLTGEGGHTFPLLAKIEVSLGAHQQRLFDVLEGNFERKESERVKLAKEIFGKLDEQLKSLIKRFFSTPEYYFKIPEAGEYEILVKKAGFPQNWRLEKIVSGSGEELTVPLAEREEKGVWWSLGKRWFDAGDCYLIFKGPALVNLLTNNWQEGWDEDNFYAVYQQVENLEAKVDYKLSFKYKAAEEEQRAILTIEKRGVDTFWFDKGVLDEPPSKVVTLVDENLRGYGPNEWHDFDFVFSSDKEIKAANLSFSRQADPKKAAKVEFKEAKIERVVAPRIAMRKIKETNYSHSPQINFRRVNPTKYIVDIKGAVAPYFLVFSESFHRGWRAYIKEAQKDNSKVVGQYFSGEIKEKEPDRSFLDERFFESWGQEQIAEKNHLSLNGYANSWYITPDDTGGKENYQLIIEYWPQRLFYGGALASLLTLITVLGLAFFKKRKSKN